jgi:hypothetical protein
MSDSTPDRLTLPDARRLAWAEYGDAASSPLLYLHGTRSCSAEPAAFGVARRRGMRVIAPERPGMGGSGFQPGRRLVDWPTDLTALADHLGVERFSVLGYPAASPFPPPPTSPRPGVHRRAGACVVHLPVGTGGRPGLQWSGPEALTGQQPRLARLAMTLGMRLPA